MCLIGTLCSGDNSVPDWACMLWGVGGGEGAAACLIETLRSGAGHACATSMTTIGYYTDACLLELEHNLYRHLATMTTIGYYTDACLLELETQSLQTLGYYAWRSATRVIIATRVSDTPNAAHAHAHCRAHAHCACCTLPPTTMPPPNLTPAPLRGHP